jgi:hypothetical protein
VGARGTRVGCTFNRLSSFLRFYTAAFAVFIAIECFGTGVVEETTFKYVLAASLIVYRLKCLRIHEPG